MLKSILFTVEAPMRLSVALDIENSFTVSGSGQGIAESVLFSAAAARISFARCFALFFTLIGSWLNFVENKVFTGGASMRINPTNSYRHNKEVRHLVLPLVSFIRVLLRR